MLGDQRQEGQSLETCKRFQSCLGKAKGDLSCLGELGKEKKRERFLLLCLVFYKHQSGKTKAIKMYTFIPLEFAMFLSLRTLRTYLFFWVMRFAVKLAQIMLFWHTCSPFWVLSPKEMDEEGKRKAILLFLSLMCLQTSPVEVGGKWGRGYLNYVNAQWLGAEKCSPFGELSAFYDLQKI